LGAVTRHIKVCLLFARLK